MKRWGPRRTGVVERDQERSVPDPVLHGEWWEPDVGSGRTLWCQTQVPRDVHILIMYTIH